MNQNIITTDKMSELGKKVFDFVKAHDLNYKDIQNSVADTFKVLMAHVKSFLDQNPSIEPDKLHTLYFYDASLFEGKHDRLLDTMACCDLIATYAFKVLTLAPLEPEMPEPEEGILRPISPPKECYEYQGHAAMIDFSKMYGDDIRV